MNVTARTPDGFDANGRRTFGPSPAAQVAEPKITIHELDPYWQKKIRGLKTENQKMRRERNEAQQQVTVLTAALAAALAISDTEAPGRATHEPGTTA